MRTLVVGCDASGKSSLLRYTNQHFGDIPYESTNTEKSRAFKQNTAGLPIDIEHINTREALYLALTFNALQYIRTFTLSNVSTDATLVTRLSHDTMRRCIGAQSIDDDEIINQWLDDEAEIGIETPDAIALTHAPIDVIKARIECRQNSGDSTEEFWGFNSLFFLDQYQERWMALLPKLANLGIECIRVDTTACDGLDSYLRMREHDQPARMLA